MEQIWHSRKARFVFVVGVLLWGGSTALLTTLWDWHRTGHFDSPPWIVIRFAIFMTMGIVGGLWTWKSTESLGRKKITRAGSIVQFVLFIGLMLGLVYLLWRMR